MNSGREWRAEREDPHLGSKHRLFGKLAISLQQLLELGLK